jgi:light-regulated signal transduction histidine kinase (bacteriophytochrome)
MRHTRVGIADLVKQVQQELALSLKNRKVVWTLEPLPEVTGDPTLLKQVLVSMQQASRRTFARYSYQARRRWCNGQARSLSLKKFNTLTQLSSRIFGTIRAS